MKASSKKEGQIDLFFGNDIKRRRHSLHKKAYSSFEKKELFFEKDHWEVPKAWGEEASFRCLNRDDEWHQKKIVWKKKPLTTTSKEESQTCMLWNSFQTKCIFFFFQVQWTLKWNFLFRSYSASCFEQVWKVFGVQLAFTESSLSQGIEISKVVTFLLRRRNILAKQ